MELVPLWGPTVQKKKGKIDSVKSQEMDMLQNQGIFPSHTQSEGYEFTEKAQIKQQGACQSVPLTPARPQTRSSRHKET